MLPEGLGHILKSRLEMPSATMKSHTLGSPILPPFYAVNREYCPLIGSATFYAVKPRVDGEGRVEREEKEQEVVRKREKGRRGDS
jgi:hypothetical protein